MLFRAAALLVDIDGTLVDSTAAVVASWTTWAALHRLDAGQILRVCHGRRTQDTVAMFLPAERVPSATRQLEELELAVLDGVTALPGAQVLLRDLPASRWAGVTSGSHKLMRARLAAAGRDSSLAGRRWGLRGCRCRRRWGLRGSCERGRRRRRSGARPAASRCGRPSRDT
jgi:beta-phosphoglucomutase-like phosphatase (HAD superfamily)